MRIERPKQCHNHLGESNKTLKK